MLETLFLNIKANKQVFLMSVSTTVTAFSILGLFFLVFTNLNTLLLTWDKQVQLIVYLEDKISKRQSVKLESSFKSHKEIDSFSFVSRKDAWKKFKNTFSEKSKFIDVLGFNPLPASYILKFKDSPDRLKNIRTVAEKIKNQEGIEALEYGEKWLSRFERFMIFLRIFILCVGGMLCTGLIIIISNTIKLSIYSRQEEIDLMLLLGATHRSIKAPILLEGLIQGLIGVIIALGIVKLMHVYVRYQFQGSIESVFRGVDIQFISNSFFWAMIISSIFVGCIGSLISINQFLNARNRK